MFRRRKRTGRTKQEHDHAEQRNTGELGLVVEYEGGKNSNKSWKKRNASKYSTNSAETRLPKKQRVSLFEGIRLTKTRNVIKIRKWPLRKKMGYSIFLRNFQILILW